MQSAAPHPRERARLSRLHALGLLDTGAEKAFDRITRLAQTICAAPIALISFLDRYRQWFKSRQGLAVTETHQSIAFCAHTILGQEPMLVEDARVDPRFCDNPLVTGEPDVAFYAGVPLRMPEVHRREHSVSSTVRPVCSLPRRRQLCAIWWH